MTGPIKALHELVERHRAENDARRTERDALDERARATTPEQRTADRAASERAEVSKTEAKIDNAQRAQLDSMRERFGIKLSK